jgi:signal transduction histidine kinase
MKTFSKCRPQNFLIHQNTGSGSRKILQFFQSIISGQVDRLATIRADRERIAHVLRNLISNALKYSPDSDRIVINSFSDEEKIAVCVQDSGIGINSEQQKKLFTRFLRFNDESVKRNAGLGFGL